VSLKSECKVDMVAFRKWDADVEAGKKAPDGVVCEECDRRGILCELPQMRLRVANKRKIASAAADEEVGKKKPRKGDTSDTSGPTWVEALLTMHRDLLKELKASAAEQKRAAYEQERIAEALIHIAQKMNQPPQSDSSDDDDEVEEELDEMQGEESGERVPFTMSMEV